MPRRRHQSIHALSFNSLACNACSNLAFIESIATATTSASTKDQPDFDTSIRTRACAGTAATRSFRNLCHLTLFSSLFDLLRAQEGHLSAARPHRWQYLKSIPCLVHSILIDKLLRLLIVARTEKSALCGPSRSNSRRIYLIFCIAIGCGN